MKGFRFLIITALSLLTVTRLSAQTTRTYDQRWKKVDSLIQKRNLPKSALEEVKYIYNMAKTEGQDAQVIKALVYMTSLQQENREDNPLQAIKDVEKELATAKEPAASVIRSLLAGMYWQYFQSHRYQMYGRTATTTINKADLATWSPIDFHQKVSDLYLASLKNESLLKRTRLEPFDAIIIKGNVRHLRPALYDLLAHQALEYFENDERDIAKPAYAFEISEPEAFAPASRFVKHKFVTRDSLSLQHKALLLYQDLVAFHSGDTKKDALLDVDIQRIEFVHQNAVTPDKDTLYVQALKGIISQYKDNPEVSQAVYLLAAYYEEKADTYKPLGDTTHRMDRTRARDLLKGVVRDSTVKNEGWVNAYNLLQQIEHPSFSFKVENVNIPGQPFRALVEYRNITGLTFRVIRSDEALEKAMQDRSDDKYWTALLKAPAVKEWQQSFPATGDLQEHSVEVKVDGLPVGKYFLVASPDTKWSAKKSLLGARSFYVSNISYVNKGNRFFVLHRETGQPLAKASATVYRQEYRYDISRYDKAKLGSFVADDHGYFEIPPSTEFRNNGIYVDIVHGTDRLFLDELNYSYFYTDAGTREQKQPAKVFFFLDRSIYRPGQVVYFKGIAVNSEGRSNSIATGYKTTVYLRDANYQVRDSMKVTTNEFGSFNGKFTLPQTGLTGMFHIQEKSGNNTVNFSVEEYKRPKFYVDYNKVAKTYKVGDPITVTGTAKAYAGNNVDGARVAYRVVRQPRFLYPWLTWRRWWLPPSEPQEIAHGEITTGPDGGFSISFTAIPDKTIDPKLEPVFDYKVHVDITDINGETRSGEKVISAGYKSLVLKVAVDEKLPVDSLKHLSIRTENMNGEYQPSTVQVSVTRLIPEQRLIRERLWEQTDQHVMSKEEYIALFPHDEWANEKDPKSWKEGEVVYTRSDSTRVNTQLPVEGKALQSGYYKITVTTKDKDGQEVKDVRYVELFDEQNKGFTTPVYLWTKGSTPIEPGESTSIKIGSSAPNVFVVNETDKTLQGPVVPLPKGAKKKSDDTQPEDGTGNISFFTLNNEKKRLQYTATEAERGGYGVNFFFVKDNRLYQYGDVITVPWSNKELRIEYATFRDKILPGSEEKWKVRISGYKNEKVAAEMLASMYDASLDQFRMHQWNKPMLWPVYSYNRPWNGAQNFAGVESDQKWIDYDTKFASKEYDQLAFSLDDLLLNGPSGRGKNMRYGYIGERKVGVVNQEGVKDMAVAASAPKVEMSKFTPPAIKRDEEVKEDTTSISTTRSENAAVQIRKNFNETAFFFPDLRAAEDGTIEFSFTAPEALTRWKLQTLAHTKDLSFGFSQKEMVTQKELMVQPNAPRFLRQGDHLEFTAKIVNLSGKEFTGQAQLELIDAATNQSVDGWFLNTFPNQYFTVGAGQSEVVKFPIQVPFQFTSTLVWRVTARAGTLSDGEENLLPVLTNKVLVTETLPMPVRGTGTKTFTFSKLLQSGGSETLQNQSLAVEYTSNPAWYAVQALPYLMEYPYDCAEQMWNRYYANALAAKIVSSAPRIRQIFEQWKTMDTAALLSNLQKNGDLKSALLEETPWVMAAQSETQQKKNIALLFDMVKLAGEQQKTLEKLKALQSSNGGFVWFKGGPDDRYITQYIVTGIGHLARLGVSINDLKGILTTAIPYLDRKIKEEYDNLVKSKVDLLKQQPGYLAIHYLYMRSFFPGQAIPGATEKAYSYYKKQAATWWMKGNKYMQGMTALALSRTGEKGVPAAILQSLKETALDSDEMGLYWKDNSFGYSWFWWYAPIETQALLIEAFTEIGNDTKTVDDLRTWLIKNKQTNNWRTTKATADACYAMLLQGTDWLTAEPLVTIKLGDKTLSSTTQRAEAGTGYFKQTIPGRDVKPSMGNITVSVEKEGAVNTPTGGSNGHTASAAPSWGVVYWQYFEDMDKVTSAATPLQLDKKLFIEKNTDRGPVLSPVTEGTELHVGDKIKVRIELRVDRDMEYVHMKDMRASALEPVNVLSGYRWQGGLGYYESTRDISTSFFFNYLPKGTFVFEYPLFVTHTGTFSNGITTIQCMYAPEFSAHSEGVKITVE